MIYPYFRYIYVYRAFRLKLHYPIFQWESTIYE